MRFGFLFVLAFITTSGAVQAAGQLYECDITQRDKRVGWLSPKVAVILPQQGGAQVYDAVILNFHGKPIPARVRKQGDMLRVNWTLKNVRDGSNQRVGRFDFNVNIDTKTMAAHLIANPTQFPNRWTGRGMCKVKSAR